MTSPVMSITAEDVITTMIDVHSNDDGKIEVPTDEVDRALAEIVVKQKRATKKKTRDPDAPKRALSAYMLWLGDTRAAITEEHCSMLEGKAKVIATTKKAGVLWNALSDEDKVPYQDKAEILRKEYHEKMKIYKPDMVHKPTKQKGPKYDPEDIPSATYAWQGPFEMTFLKSKVKDENGKSVRIIKDFLEAVKRAEGLNATWLQFKDDGEMPTWWSDSSPPCAGITKTGTGYDLRLGSTLETTPTSHKKGGIASWTYDMKMEKMDTSPTDTPPTPGIGDIEETNEVSLVQVVSMDKKEERSPSDTPTQDTFKDGQLPKKVPTQNKQIRRLKKPFKKVVEPKYPLEELDEIEIEKDGTDVTFMLHEESGDVFNTTNLGEPVGKVEGEDIMFF